MHDDVPNPVPVTLLGGFLGSGKTTLLNRLLREPGGRRIAVIVNELGEIAIDGALVTGGETFVELDNGCLCCALNEDLVTTLAEIGRRPDLDQVVIETTGIADPLPIGHAITRRELGARFRLDAIVVTADALNLEKAVAAAPEPEQQIRRADIVLLTKVDLVSPAERQRIEGVIHSLAPAARLLGSDHPGLVELLLDARLPAGPAAGRLLAPAGNRHRDHGFESLSVDVGEGSTLRLAFEEFLEGLPPGVYRSKGIVKLDGETGRIVFHTVGGRVDLWHEPMRSGPGQLVFIGKGFDGRALEEEVRMLFEAPT